MNTNNNKYIPALSHERFTPFYDPLMHLFMRESTFKHGLIEQANIKKGYHVLDIGCGTATLTILIKKIHPDTEVTGLDGDPEILKMARKKVINAGVDIKLDHG
ncbi:MAG: methyltransferase domain-containing protein, partial [Candidatus Methanoperedens sp.]|nr:methyltransferase domain-containing protein [Candidatus Methanoperedens sp.]